MEVKMKEKLRKIIKKIMRYLREFIEEEMAIMDAFYGSFGKANR
jgi:hypothetical protein